MSKQLKDCVEPIVTNIILKEWANTLEDTFLTALKEVEGNNGQIGIKKVKEVFSHSQILALNSIKNKAGIK